MADQKITELPIKGVSGINLADYLLGIDAAEGYQMLISDLAKKIIEQYAGSTLAGTAQPIKDALDTVAENTYGNIATIESGTTASKAYAVGDRMVLDGLLYKVTSAITQGGTITIGSNVILDALADDVAAVEREIGNTSISGIGNGTITGALSTLNGNVMDSSTSTITSMMSSGTVNVNRVVKSGRSLNIAFLVTNTSTPATGVFAQLPEGYRPQGERWVMGEIIFNGNRLPMRFKVDANGNIELSYSSSPMTQVEVAGTIPM